MADKKKVLAWEQLQEYHNKLKETFRTKDEEITTEANNVYFDDGTSLEEKYINGELGGGTSIDDEIILTYITNSSFSVANGSDISIEYNFVRENNTTRKGTEKVYVDGVLKSSRSVSQGDVSATINSLSIGTHTIEITITSSGLESSLIYTVEVIELTINSTFDGFNVYGSDITYRYTPIGNIEKTIYFKVDNETYGTETITESGKTMTYELTGLSHGSHSLEVYMTAYIGDLLVTSNKLTYELVVNSGGTETIIGCPFNITEATQGDLLVFEYVVCNPNYLTADVTLKINDEVVSSLTVDRTKQVWSLRDYPTGEVTFTIESGDASVSFVVQVEELDINVEPITHNLELYLTANGRNNTENEEVRSIWENNGIKATFSNFNWSSNGWLKDDNQDSILRVNGDAKVTIPIKLFEEDFRSIGKTIEFEFSTHDVRDYDSILINCMSSNRGFSLTSNVATLKSEQSSVETKFKEDEKVRIAFVIEPTSENRLIYTYINGVISGLTQYPSDDNFSQSTPIGITIGSSDATIDIYNIRIYNINLDHSDILTNYIADTTDIDTKLKLYNTNKIFDGYGNINYNQVLERIPCLTIIGTLPGSKGDKKTVSIKYVNLEDTTKSFTASSVTLDIQGTSSQYYPRKNYMFKLTSDYKLTDNSIPEKVFCLKADYMESSHSHNTGLAKIVNSLYPETPASAENELVQAAITGFPIVVFHQKTVSSTPECLGVYNFNNDKDDVTTFGYTNSFPNCESWEFCNNTSAHCLFQSDNFEDTTEVAKNFEARYPDKFTNYTNLSRVVSWVVSTQGNLEKFKNEFESYFNLEATLLYYCLTELFAMVDSRAKNLFLTTWDGSIWYPTFYDMDTAFGLNNEGVNGFDYSVEYHDTEGSQNVFNGESSVLWNNFEQAFADEIAEFYIALRNDEKVTYDSVMAILYGEQISKICENNYNYDAIEKYKNPLVEDNIGTYLYVAQGSRIEHLKRWIFNRINYMDSKYGASDFKENYMTLRIYTPESYGSVIPNADAHITPYTDQYISVKYDENMFSERGTHDVETTIEAPEQVFNDTPMIIYGASGISSIGDLSPLYPGTVDVSSGVKLKQLIIGNAAEDYSNTNLKVLTIGNNELLKILDVRNCPSLTQPIDASGCSGIEEIYATGTSITAVKLPNGGNLKILHLPRTVSNLTLLNQPFLSNLTMEDYLSITTLRIENCPKINERTILKSATNLERIRITNINWSLYNSEQSILNNLMKLKGLNENGINTDKAVLTGKVHIAGQVGSASIDKWNEYFGNDLEITADEIVQSYIVTFVNYDGTVLEEVVVLEGGTAVYSGETPTRPDSDEGYSYEFAGWDKTLTNITSNMTVTAQYTNNKPTIFVLDLTDETLLQPSVYVYYIAGSVTIDWGDGSIETYTTSASGATTCLKSTPYSNLGVYTIKALIEPTTIPTKSNRSIAISKDYGYSYAKFVISLEYQSGMIARIYTCALGGYSDGNIVVSSLKIPSSLKIVDKNAVYYKGIENIYYEGQLTDFFNITFSSSLSTRGITEEKMYVLNDSGDYYLLEGNIIVPDGVTTITMAFSNYDRLTSIEIPSSVTSIESSAFYNCTGLTSLEIPSSVTSIGSSALQIGSSTNKAIITFEGATPPTISSSTFNKSYLKEIRVPAEGYNDYITATNWSSFASYIVAYGVGITTNLSKSAILFNSQKSYAVEYINTEETENEITVVSSDTSVATISDLVINDGNFTFNVNSLAKEGNATITLTLTAGDKTSVKQFDVIVLETTPISTYTVEAIDGVTYGFTLNASGYYESTNKAVASSFSLCKVVINASGVHRMYLDCINYADTNYDFGILSNVDTTLTSSYGVDSTNVFKSFKGSSMASVQTVDYGVIEEGEHFIYIKFRKDSSGNNYNDSLQFQVRFEL